LGEYPPNIRHNVTAVDINGFGRLVAKSDMKYGTTLRHVHLFA